MSEDIYGGADQELAFLDPQVPGRRCARDDVNVLLTVTHRHNACISILMLMKGTLNDHPPVDHHFGDDDSIRSL